MSAEASYDTFCHHVRRLTGLDLEQYNPKQMERRIGNLMQRHGVSDYRAYATLLSVEPARLAEFLNFVPINVTEFFRNPESFLVLRQRILPDLYDRSRPLALWSAACADGSEPYSLAITLRQARPDQPYRILATDVDEGALAEAREGRYMEGALKNMPPEERKRSFKPVGDRWQIAPMLKQGVEFRRHDLLKDPYPAGWDFIACRNVLIYFKEAAKRTIHEKLARSLRLGGYLFVGGTETIMHPAELELELVASFFYRRRSPKGA